MSKISTEESPVPPDPSCEEKESSIVLFSIIGLIVYLYINNLSEFQLKCIVSDEDGNKYCVRERSRIDDAADLLAKTTQKCKDLVDYMKNKYPDIKLSLLVSEGCMPSCPFKTEHDYI